jgi:hypothetical protein
VVVGDPTHLEDGVEETVVDLLPNQPGQKAVADTGGTDNSAGDTL